MRRGSKAYRLAATENRCADGPCSRPAALAAASVNPADRNCRRVYIRTPAPDCTTPGVPRQFVKAERARRLKGALPGDRPKRANPGVALGLHPGRERDPVLLGRLRDMQRRLGPEVRAHQSALIRKDGYADLERITCPSLVVACRQDRLRSFGETERMAKHLPHARFEIIEDCGHMAPLEKPRELAALLTGWIEAAIPA